MHPGEVIASRFEVERVIGSGGMGVVYRAWDRVASAPVAVKVMLDASPRAHERFEREARLVAELDDPSIVRHIAHGRTERGEPFLAMEWLEGEDLATRLDRGALSVGETIAVASGCVAALSAAHARGVVHRDVKPANVFLVRGQAGAVKLLDFGIARELEAKTELTRTGARLGTVGYMSPEAARGDRVEPAADVFSLGCVLFECLTGRPAFGGTHAVAILAKILLEDPPRVRDLRPEVPTALDALVARLLTKDPASRPSAARVIATELANIDLGSTTASATSGVSPPPATELRFATIVFVAAPALEVMHAATVEAMSAEATVRNLVAPYGGTEIILVDGSIVVTFERSGTATDRAVMAARSALAIRQALPEAILAVATGRTSLTDRVPFGEAMDRAALLAADSGRAIHLDAVTASLVEGRFELAPLGDAFELRRKKDVSTEHLFLGRPAPCVGRERDLRMLRAAVEECFEAPAASGVIVSGAAGIGKTRLTHELLRTVRFELRARTWSVECDVMSAHSPRAALRALVRSLIGIASADEANRIAARIRTHVVECGARDVERIAMYLGELVGAEASIPIDRDLEAARIEPARMNREISRAWLELVDAELAKGPIALFVDDLHWCDPVTLEHLVQLLEKLDDRPLAILGFARPEVDTLLPPAGRGGFQRIELAELRPRAAREIVRSALGSDISDAVVDAAVSRAGGNAFFLKEIIRALAAGRSDLPETVLATLEARFEALSEQARRILRSASVFGEVFWVDAVTHAVGHGPTSLDAAIDALVASDLVLARPESRFARARELAFRHALVREAAYAGLEDEDRRTLHGLAFDWLESAGEQDVRVLAEHAERAARGELDRIRASVYWLRAAESAFAAAAPADCRTCCERGLAMLHGVPRLSQVDELEIGLQLRLASAIASMSYWAAPEVSVAAARVRELAESLSDDVRLASALFALAQFSIARGAVTEGRDIAARALQHAVAAPAPRVALALHALLVQCAVFSGDAAQASRDAEAAYAYLPTAAGAGPDVVLASIPEVSLPSWDALRLTREGHFGAARRRAREAIARAEEKRHAYTLTMACNVNCLVEFARRDVRALLDVTERACALADEYGFSYAGGTSRIVAGLARLYAGERSVDLIHDLDRCLERAYSGGARSSMAGAHSMIAEARIACGDLEGARRDLAHAERLERETTDRIGEIYRMMLSARLAIATGRVDEAEATLREAITTAQGRGHLGDAFGVALDLAKLLVDTGRRLEARSMLAATIDGIVDADDAAIVVEARTLLDSLA